MATPTTLATYSVTTELKGAPPPRAAPTDGMPTFVNGHGPCGHAVFFLASELDRVMNVYMSLPRETPAGN